MSTTTGPGRKPVRRVRVIEFLDDEELDEATVDAVLAEADAAEPAEIAATEKDEAAATEKVERPERPGAAGKPEEEPAAAERPSRARRLPALPSGAGGRTTALLTAGVVVLALLAGFALFQWRSAASAAAEREEIVARVSAFGEVMATYSYEDVESANEKALTYLTGDALAERKKVDLDALREQFQSQKTRLRSTTYAVYVGSVDGSLASAVLVFDLRGESSALQEPQTIGKSHLTLGLIKRDGTWMISSMVPAGSESTASTTSVTSVPSAGPTSSPAEKDGEKGEKN
ncbi:hypothetical protein [Actinocorallia libanotica]|uniref:Mce-associated membrane protein n=1 Tax=Actinocorallia libanotica TaxID=46162 RepID=A0ABP4CGB1_9ACTN